MIIVRRPEKKPDGFAISAGRKKQQSELCGPKKTARRSPAPPERSAALVRTLASITKAEMRAVRTNARRAPAAARDLAAQWRRTRNEKYLVEITATTRAANMTTVDLIDQAFDPNPGRMQLCSAIAAACKRLRPRFAPK